MPKNALSPGEVHRDRLIARLGDRLEREASRLAAAARLPPEEARAELRKVARSFRATGRELRWIGGGRLDAPRPRRLDLVSAVREAAAPWRDAFARRGYALELSATPRAIVGLWDRAHLDVLVGELLSNAARFAADGAIVLRVTGRADRVVVAVENAGAGALPPRPFVRFLRGPGARGEGMGVGLWLVDAIARQNRGRLTSARAPGGRTRVTVSLRPAARPPRGA